MADAARWVVRWSREYDDAEVEDRALASFRGADFFTRGQVEQLVDWKYPAESRRRRVRERLAAVDDERIEALTRQAFACFHDLVALLACTTLPGVEPATASVLLTAQAPDRYVVIDGRARTSLRALGRLEGGAHFDVAADWEPYLDACRHLADDAGADLTTVRRALIRAGGR